MSCDNCPDFDLCMDCFAEDQHGHHPAHSLRAVSEDKFAGSSHMQAKCDAGRGVVHEALCDGCDKVRHIITIVVYPMLTHSLDHHWRPPQVLELPGLGLLLLLLP